MRQLRKLLKIIGITLAILLTGVYALFVYISSPNSDEKLLKKFEQAAIKPVIKYKTYRGFRYRTLNSIHNQELPTIIFVHGTIGSSSDFAKYMMDEDLLKKFNFISYDRIGYNYQDKNHVQESIAFERDLLDAIISTIPSKKIIIAGYSYGGPIALASKKQVKKILLFAPAVYSKVEPMPWLLNFYKWKITRWLVPKIWQEASKEKISHKSDLRKFENKWNNTPNTIVCIHGNEDWIVPYENSLYLKKHFSNKQFNLITLNSTGHDLIWSQFSQIKQQLLKQVY
ncbi:Pimeloyl-ACP methyl ester carboxylesterase [Tenacibaculum sp. 190524A02b]|uniref:alpha/beta fold hydrolase n=1 Tax=Tenacibaculum vairaonense TaxID=3137860 RepID=UPI0032B10387